MIFLQRPEGYWDATEGLALALNAHLDDECETNDCPLSCDPAAVRETMPEIAFSRLPGGEEPLSPEAADELRLRVWVRPRRPHIISSTYISPCPSIHYYCPNGKQ